MPAPDPSSPVAASQPMMIWLPSYPRSGNKLARLILNTLFEGRTYTVYPQRGEIPVTPVWTGDWPGVVSTPVTFDDCFFMKTHEPPETEHPAVYIVRDGRDVYVSFAHFAMQHFPEHFQGMTYLDVLRMLIISRDHFSGWSRHVQAWSQRSARTSLVRFEEMVVDPARAMTVACAAIGVALPPPSGSMPGFEALKAREPQSLRKGKVGSWREEMPADVEELFWSIHGETMNALSYER